MQESKQETQFRIGGVYRQRNGATVTVTGIKEYAGMNGECYPGLKSVRLLGGGMRNIHGKCFSFAGTPILFLDLIPGELHQVDGQWLPLEEKQERDHDLDWAIEYLLANRPARVDPNAAMIARDGPAKPNGKPILPGQSFQFFAAPAAKPPIAGLTRVSAQDHRVGGWGFVR